MSIVLCGSLCSAPGAASDCESVAVTIAQQPDLTGPEKIEKLESHKASCGGSGYYEYYLGQLYGTTGQYEKAAGVLGKAVQIEMPVAYKRSAHVSVADAHHLMGDMEAATDRYQVIVESYPDWADGHLSFGVFLLGASAPKEAVAHLEKAHTLKPEAPKITRELATAYYFAGNPDAVIEFVGKTHQLIGSDMFTDRRLLAIAARAHIALGEVTHAENALGALIKADPDARSDVLVRNAIALVQKAKKTGGQ